MRRILSMCVLICIAVAFSGCGEQKATNAPTANQEQTQATAEPEKNQKQDIKKMEAEQIVLAFQAAGLPVAHIQVCTAENDPNHLMGRPNQYISKANFADTRIEQFDVEANPTGGCIEIFENNADAKARYDYVEAVSGSASVFSMYLYLYENVLLRIDGQLTPEQAKEYNAVFEQMQKGEFPKE